MGWRRRRRRGSRPEQGAEQGGESGGESGGKWEEEWWGVEVEFVVCGAEVRGRRDRLGERESGGYGCLVGRLVAEGAGRGGGGNGLEWIGKDGRTNWAFGVGLRLQSGDGVGSISGVSGHFDRLMHAKIYSDYLGPIVLEYTACRRAQITSYVPSHP